MVRRVNDAAQSSDKLNKGPHSRSRARFWQVAKGLFGQSSPQTKLEGQTLPHFLEPPRPCRRSISTPSLNPFRGSEQNDFNTSFPTALATHSLSMNQRKPKPPALGRPIISPPSFVQHLDKYDLSNPKLSYPLSPVPSPSGSSFSISSTPFPSVSKPSASDDDSAVRSTDVAIDRPARRRTKSAPDAKLPRRLVFSPALSTAYEVEPLSSPSSIHNGVSSLHVNAPPSPPLGTPQGTYDYFPSQTRPDNECTSPRSFTQVKRKPVPTHLLVEPPNHCPSTPSTPLASFPTTPQLSGMALSNPPTSFGTPLLSESELWASRLCKKDLTLLPIGQGRPSSRPGSSSRRHHRRSFSDQAVELPIHPVVSQSPDASQFDAPEEELENVLPSKGLSPPPLRIQSPNRTPPQTPDGCVAQSCDTHVNGGRTRSGALSPLTDEELRAMRSFVCRDGTAYRARQRRKRSEDVRNISGRRLSRRSGSYELHARIFDSYREESERLATQGSDDEDVDSHLPMSSPISPGGTARSEIPEVDEDEPDCGGSVVGQYELLTPADMVNRGTFGYYDGPMVRNSRSRRGINAVYAYAYVPQSDDHLQDWCQDDDDDMYLDTKDSFDLGDALLCPEAAPFTQELLVAEVLPRMSDDASSLYGGRSSSDFLVYADDERPERSQFLTSSVAISDSESDRPNSWYSSAASDLATSSEASASSVAIGVPILSPRQIARITFVNERSAFSVSSCELESEEDVDGTPTTVACSSPVQGRMERDFEIGDLSTSSDRLQSCLTKSDGLNDARRYNAIARPSVVPCVLKPALHIESDASTASSSTEFPSPTETCVSSPYQAFSPKMRALTTPDWKRPRKDYRDGLYGGGGVSSTDESSVQDSVTSFMNMTPNEPPKKKQSRVRLRQFLSRTNLRLGAGRKASSGTLHA